MLHNKELNINLPFVLAALYLFFNSVGLPEGLLYTSLLTPLFLFENIKKGRFFPFSVFFTFTAFFAIYHITAGANATYYLRSWLMAFCNFQFCLIAYYFLKEENAFQHIAPKLLFINTILLVVFVLFRFIGSLKNIGWYLVPISPGLPEIPRLKMLTSEASVYSLMIAPLFIWLLFNRLQSDGKSLFLLGTVCLSLALSFSLGVIICIVISVGLVFLIHSKKVFLNKRNSKILLPSIIISVAILLLVFLLSDQNIIKDRLLNIIEGKDTSARGRTYEAFILAWRIIKEKSILFGIGLGQIKEYGRPIILGYYRYVGVPEVVRIPNASAEMLTYFGLTGLLLKLSTEIFLFYKTKVAKSPFRLALFLFVFIYQFTGSYVTNIAEYLIWIIAFSSVSSNQNSLNESPVYTSINI